MTAVRVSSENNFGLITLNDPSIHNALKNSDVEKINLTLSSWKNLKLDAILITGSGKSFCSGLFLEEFNHKNWITNPISAICENIEACECPVICALNGAAYGGAVEIALACDFRVANNDIVLMIPAANLGIHYESSGLRRAINILGPSITRKLFLLGETISFQDLIKTNFVDFWVERDETVLDKSKQLINNLSGKVPLAVSGMKRTIIEILNNSLDVEATNKRIQACFNSEEHKEAMLARKREASSKFRSS